MEIFTNERHLEVVVHDLRTPLNVMVLSLKMIEQLGGQETVEIEEDLRMIRDNVAELERMLTFLVDYERIPATRSRLAIERFDPSRMIQDFVSAQTSRNSSPSISLEIVDPPTEVRLDPIRTNMALEKVLANALAVSAGKPVRIRLSGGKERCIIEFEVDVAPRETVQSHEIDPTHFERLLGTASERRGIELAIASKISKLFGGKARLEATPGVGTRVTLDWPTTVVPE